MDLLIASLTVLGTFIAGIIGNIVAHDFCEFTPKLCRQLISRAAGCLPDGASRERYAEEWLAHLSDCRGVFEQYRHAATCIIGARRLRRISARAKPGFKRTRIEFAGIGVVDLDYVTTIAATYFLCSLVLKLKSKQMVLEKFSRIPRMILLVEIFVATLCSTAFASRKYGRIDNKQVKALLKIVIQAIREKNKAIIVEIDGKRLNLSIPSATGNTSNH